MICDDKVAKAKALLGEAEEGVASGGLHKVSERPSRAILGTLSDRSEKEKECKFQVVQSVLERGVS